jgi:hypothetical protein
MHVLHCHKLQTSLNATLAGTLDHAAILKSAFTQHSWWHGRKLARMTKKVICNFGFLNNNNNNSLLFSFNVHYHLSSLLAFCVVLCVCDISFQSLPSTFIIYPSSKSFGAQGLKFESSLQVIISTYLFPCRTPSPLQWQPLPLPRPPFISTTYCCHGIFFSWDPEC